MVYTVTLNPAIDYTMVVEEYKTGAVNRSSSETMLPGGKGINVARVLARLGVETTALGFVAGEVGEELLRMLADCGMNTDFIRLDNGMTRINVKIKADTETEINGAGPNITMDDINTLKNRLEAMNDGDTLVLAGSVPRGLPESVYCDILEGLKDKKINIVVDAEGETLMGTLKYTPFLIKPNIHELSAIFGKTPNGVQEIEELAKELIKKGAKNVLVSMGADGAVMVNKERSVFYEAPASKKVVNTTGSGDAMVAGFIAGFGDNGHFDEALRMGIAAGSASAFCFDLATTEEILGLYNELK